MKLPAGVILCLSLLELFHCVPLISDNGGFKETNTSSSWGYHAGIDSSFGLEAGLKNGVGVLGVKKHLGANIGGNTANSRKDTNYIIYPVSAPNPPVTGSSYYPAPGPVYYPAPGAVNNPGIGFPNYQITGPQYYPVPGAPNNNQYATQPAQQWPTPNNQQSPQTNPQYPVSSQYTQQGYVPQSAPQQNIPQGGPQQNIPQGDPQQNTPQGGPQQYAPQGAQIYAPVPQYAQATQYASAPLYASVPQYAPPKQNAPVIVYMQRPQAVPQGTQVTLQYTPANGNIL